MLHQSSVSASNKIIGVKPGVGKRKSPIESFTGASKEEKRFLMISEAAYYRALGRGFGSGDQLQDWLISEVQIDGLPLDHS